MLCQMQTYLHVYIKLHMLHHQKNTHLNPQILWIYKTSGFKKTLTFYIRNPDNSVNSGYVIKPQFHLF